MRNVAALCLMALLACAPVRPTAESASMNEDGILFIGGTVAAGAAQTPLKDHAIYVRQGTIVDVGPTAALQSAHPNARVMDASGATILPGLVDAHAHLY